MKRPSKVLVLTALVLIIILQAAPWLLTRLLGKQVSMTAQLYDPTDLFRGDYVQIKFEEETAKEDQILIEDAVNKNGVKDVFVTLRQQGPIWKIATVSKTPPTKGIYLRAKKKSKGRLNLDFGMDRVYVPQRYGRELEKIEGEYALVVDMRIFRGRAVVTGLKKRK